MKPQHDVQVWLGACESASAAQAWSDIVENNINQNPVGSILCFNDKSRTPDLEKFFDEVLNHMVKLHAIDIHKSLELARQEIPGKKRVAFQLGYSPNNVSSG